MNKKELIARVSDKTALSKKDTEKILNAMMDVVKETLQKKESIQIVGFGNFKTKERKSKEARNPKTGEPMTIPASIVPVFKTSKQLKEYVNQK